MEINGYVLHLYTSTYCQHERHLLCQSDWGTDAGGNLFARHPGQCKLCAAPCRCPCHEEGPQDEPAGLP